MNAESVSARSAIESLRAGVPSRHAVAQLGTTQNELRDEFEERLQSIADGGAGAPIVVAANFGAGKSHLLNYLQTLAETRGFATAFVVISPEMPLGNAHVVLKTIAENAHAPGRTGKALRSLAAALRTDSEAYAGLREWSRDAPIQDRFRALLHLYEEYRADEELRTQILSDIEGKPLLMTVIKKRLKDIKALAGYDLKSPRNPLMAHDRIRLLARFVRAGGCKGLVVLFDEMERMAKFSLKQRFAAYQELGWWRSVAEEAGSATLPVFTMTRGFMEETVTGGTHDEARYQSSAQTFAEDERDQAAVRGIALLKKSFPLDPPTPEQEEQIKYRVQAIYESAYGVSLPPLPPERDVRTSIRSQIRRWITYWDLHRYDPEYRPMLEEETVHFDTHEIGDEVLTSDEETED